MDYMIVYKKWTWVTQESYKLDHIAELELGIGKLSFGEGSAPFKWFTEGAKGIIVNDDLPNKDLTKLEKLVRLRDRLKSEIEKRH
jgi:hypothetical protein